MFRRFVCFYVVLLVCYVCYAFDVPDPTLEVLRPRGFRLSIPDVEGIKLFAFHGKLNEEMNGREGGFFSRDITKAKNGRWTFYDPTTEIKVGDTLYFWTYVDYFDGRNKLGYPRDDQVIQVTEQHIVSGGGHTTTKKPISVTPGVIVTPGGICEDSITTYNGGQTTCKGTILFSEVFNKIQPNRWTTEVKFADAPDYEFVMYVKHDKVINVNSGRLLIQPVLTTEIFGEDFVTSPELFNLGASCTGKPGTVECSKKSESYVIKPPVASALLTTKNSFSFLYGKIEIKAKLPRGDWIYPELYLSSKNEEYGEYYQSGQIRIAFLPGNTEMSKVLYGGCVLGNSNGGRNHAMKTIRRTTNWSSGFHRFAVEWTDEKITLSVNDNVYGHIFPPEGGFASLESQLDLEGCDRWRTSSSELAPFDKEMYIALGVGVGGLNFADRSDGSKPWTNDEPKAQKKFYKNKSLWYSTWSNQSSLEVRHVKVFAI